MKKGLVIIPYAYIDGFSIGVNIRKQGAKDIYLKNCCVASISARKKCGINTDVAIISNIDIPEPYKSLLESQSVKIINYSFDEFNFNAQYA